MSSGCGCKEVYRYPHITYPYSSCICSFLQQYILIFLIKHRGVYFVQAASRCDVYLRAAFIRGRCLLISYNPVDSQLKL